MNGWQSMVTEFHRKFGFTINEMPTILDDELWRVRHDNTLKELKELETAHINRDIVAVADAITDLNYFTIGTAVASGIDLDPVFEEIHRSNMTKDRPVGGGDKKAVKGPNYSKPNLVPIIARQVKTTDIEAEARDFCNGCKKWKDGSCNGVA